MTEAETLTDPLREFRAHLSRKVNAQLRDTGRAAVLVHRATYEHGWTAKQLGAECMRDHGGAVNAAGIVMHRLEWCADHPPATKTTGTAKRPFCSDECRDNQGWVLDDDLRPAGRCPCRTTS